ncbi:MAG TPA: nitroreductase family protein, partial [Candidatus Micrarchaeota archaeon]|nr:nitroreductase family protein [Candidatus Micrarchaeota archaeon]
MDFMQIVKSRYATKKFDGKTVPQEKIEQLEEIIRFSASSFGLQTYRIKVVSDAATKEKLLPATWNQPQITTCSHLFVFCADTDLESRTKLLYDAMGSAGVPAINVEGFSKMLDGFIAKLSKEQRLVWAQKQAYIAM